MGKPDIFVVGGRHNLSCEKAAEDVREGAGVADNE